MTEFRSLLIALILGSIGAATAAFLSLPAPYITGPAVLVTLGCLAGLRTDIPAPLRNICFLIIGMIMGSGVTPAVLETAGRWPYSLLLLGISLAMTMAIGSKLLQRLYSQDRTTAILSSAPGHLSFVLSLGAGTGGDLASIGIVQSIRLLCLTLLVPVIVSIEGFHLPVAAAGKPAAMDMVSVGTLFVLCAIFGMVGHWFRLPAGLLIGSMLASTLGHLSGSFEGVTPPWLALPAYVVMGTLIGTRFSGMSISALAMNAGAGLATTAVAVLVSVAAALAAAPITGLPLASVMVAFAPGGVETMSAMALLVGADPAYVAAHHVLRLFMLTALIPLFLRGGAIRP